MLSLAGWKAFIVVMSFECMYAASREVARSRVRGNRAFLLFLAPCLVANWCSQEVGFRRDFYRLTGPPHAPTRMAPSWSQVCATVVRQFLIESCACPSLLVTTQTARRGTTRRFVAPPSRRTDFSHDTLEPPNLEPHAGARA